MADEKTLAADDAARFGNSLSAEEGGATYVANFEGDEYDGKTYKMGDTVTGLDAGTAAYLVQNGRITPTSADSAHSPAGGESTDVPTTPRAGDTGDDAITLSDTEQADADTLVADNSAAALQEMLPEGASKSGSKADLAARIVAGRR